MIECVPNTTSRNDLGKKVEGGLVEYFINKYGPPTTPEYQKVDKHVIYHIVTSPNLFTQARLNYIKSMAAYAVVCFILNVKDRHNGNILIDDDGHMVHIGMLCCYVEGDWFESLDFGFMFNISPGGNFGFEVAPFKISTEMIDMLGGRPDAEPFKYFLESIARAFLAIR